MKNSTNGNRKSTQPVYAGCYLPTSVHRKLKSLCRRERLSIAKMLERLVRDRIRQESGAESEA